MIIVNGISRIHITLIDMNGELGRIDGGVGFAIESPRVVTEIREGKCDEEESILLIKHRIKEKTGLNTENICVKVVETFDKHVGLGFTTQFSMAVAYGILTYLNVEINYIDIAKIVGRGGTSGIGVHAFKYGGFIMDLGHKITEKNGPLPSDFSMASPPPLLTRLPMPEWLVVILIHKKGKKVYGEEEVNLFRKYYPIRREDVEKLSRLILFKLIPSIIDKNIFEFLDSINQIQEMGFKRYEVLESGEHVRALMEKVRKISGGCGLSSFGPAVYTVVNSMDEALEIANKVLEKDVKIIITKPSNIGATIKTLKP